MQTTLHAVRLAGLAVTTGPLVRDFLADGLAAGQDAAALERDLAAAIATRTWC